MCGANQEAFKLIPGRSGPEFAAALVQFEHFAEQHEELRQTYAQPKPVHFDPTRTFVSSASSW